MQMPRMLVVFIATMWSADLAIEASGQCGLLPCHACTLFEDSAMTDSL